MIKYEGSEDTKSSPSIVRSQLEVFKAKKYNKHYKHISDMEVNNRRTS